jgi:predicted DNA-binding transcriptional regulator AlpA
MRVHDETLLPDPKVRERYNISGMTLWRWDRDPSLNFPKAIRIRGRNFRRLGELRAWEAAQATEVRSCKGAA